MQARIVADSNIVRHPNSERAWVKLQENREGELTKCKRTAITGLKLQGESVDQDAHTENLFLAERALKRRRLGNTSVTTYLDTRFLLSTSNICQRLFSKAGWSLENRRKGIHPTSFEAHIFLNLNPELWGLGEVNELLISNN